MRTSAHDIFLTCAAANIFGHSFWNFEATKKSAKIEN